MKKKIGAMTIGQSPRWDVAEEFLRAVGKEVELLQCGALDDLSKQEIEKLQPTSGESLLVTRLRDGTEVKIAEKHIHARMKQCVSNLLDQGAEFLVLFCTGEFPELEGNTIIIKPDVLMEKVVPAILKKGLLGAVLPSAEQIPLLGAKWEKTGLQVELAAVSPYTGTEKDFQRVAYSLAEKKVDLVVLDCIGFTEKIKQVFQNILRCPVVLPRTLLGRIVGELV
ncbi:MAG: AroM family protein [Spirochaetales bacterium]